VAKELILNLRDVKKLSKFLNIIRQALSEGFQGIYKSMDIRLLKAALL
jgi:hypothetical protein